MSVKLGTILSLVFIFMAFLFGTDLVMMQYIYTDLDSLSINASYLISKSGYITDSIKNSFIENYGVRIYPFESNDLDQSYKEGEEYRYVLEKEYSPIVISTGAIKLKIERFTIINFYN